MRFNGKGLGLSLALWAGTAFGQSDEAKTEPLRKAPAEKITVKAGFRDWGPATISGSTILAGSPTGAGGLFAVDMVSGKLKWSFRPVFSSGTASVSTQPAVRGEMVITPFAAAYPGAVVAVSLATGKEIWRGVDPMRGAAVAVSGDTAYILGKDGSFHALDARSGREQWKVPFSTHRAPCASKPIVRDGIIYLTGEAEATSGDATKPAGYYLFALDAQTGKEQWRYHPEVPYVSAGACLSQPVVTGETVYATGESRLYAVQRATGGNRWPPVDIKRPVNGQAHSVDVHGLTDAGAVLVGMTSGYLIAFAKDSGRTVWEVAGEYSDTPPSMAVAGNVLYFQGSPGTKPAARPRGTLYAMDLDTRAILWSFSRLTAEANWAFGFVSPVNGGLWVDSYGALVKLE